MCVFGRTATKDFSTSASVAWELGLTQGSFNSTKLTGLLTLDLNDTQKHLIGSISLDTVEEIVEALVSQVEIHVDYISYTDESIEKELKKIADEFIQRNSIEFMPPKEIVPSLDGPGCSACQRGADCSICCSDSLYPGQST